jgi:TonB family protein
VGAIEPQRELLRSLFEVAMRSHHRVLAFVVASSALLVTRNTLAQAPHARQRAEPDSDDAPSPAHRQPPAPKAVLVAPQLQTYAEPAYPPSKLAAGERARVVLTLTVDATGHVANAVVADSAGPEFDAAALEAAPRLVFSPATSDGAPIASKIPFAFTFDFQDVAPAAPEPPAVAPAAPVQRSTSAAAAPVDPLASATTSDIDVKGERPPAEPTRHAITGAEIVSIPGTRGDALRAIENMPGVARPPGLSGLLVVRGSGPNDTQVFVDGTPVPLAYHFGGVTSVVPSEILERIDFYPGNFSAQYGRAMGGIVDIGIRSPRKDGLHGLLQVDLLDARAMAEGPLGDSTRFLIAGRRSWVDAWLGPVMRSAGTPVSTAPRYYDYQAMLEHDLSRNVVGRVLFFGSDDRLAITVNNPSADDPAMGGDLSNTTTFWRLQGRLDSRIGEDVRWINTASVGQNTWHLSMGDKSIDMTGRSIDARSDVRVQVTPALTLVGGADVETTHFDVTTKLPPMQDPNHASGPMFAQPSNLLQASGDLVSPAAYAVLDVKAATGLTLLPGIRVDYEDPGRSLTIDPRAAVRWDVVPGDDRTTLKGGVGVFHQPPQPWEKVAPFGTPGVGPNRAVHYSVGVEQQLSRNVELSVEAFYKNLDGLVAQQPSSAAAGGVSYANTGSGRVYGTELLLRYKKDARFFGWVAYTLSQSERRESDDQPLHPFQYDQRHIFSALASYQLGRGWELGARWRFVSGNRYTPYVGGTEDFDAGAYAPVQSPQPYSASEPAFHSLDVRVEKTWTFRTWKMSAYLDVQNVYDRRNPEGTRYNYDYSRSSTVPGLPILPILGLRGDL